MCVAFAALWIRSNWWTDRFVVQGSGSRFVGTVSEPGQIGFVTGNLNHDAPLWTLITTPNNAAYFSELVSHGFFVPYWSLVFSTGLLSAFLSTGPFSVFLWRKRSWRFTLRSLFIAMTFLAVVLGMIAWLDRAWIGK
jgi:hypothetical protein